MSEKRFRLRFSDGDNGEVVNQKGVQLSPRQIVDLLNSLYDENEQLKGDAKVVLLILQAIGKLPFKISVSEAKAIKRLSENVGELLE